MGVLDGLMGSEGLDGPSLALTGPLGDDLATQLELQRFVVAEVAEFAGALHDDNGNMGTLVGVVSKPAAEGRIAGMRVPAVSGPGKQGDDVPFWAVCAGRSEVSIFGSAPVEGTFRLAGLRGLAQTGNMKGFKVWATDNGPQVPATDIKHVVGKAGKGHIVKGTGLGHGRVEVERTIQPGALEKGLTTDMQANGRKGRFLEGDGIASRVIGALSLHGCAFRKVCWVSYKVLLQSCC